MTSLKRQSSGLPKEYPQSEVESFGMGMEAWPDTLCAPSEAVWGLALAQQGIGCWCCDRLDILLWVPAAAASFELVRLRSLPPGSRRQMPPHFRLLL